MLELQCRFRVVEFLVLEHLEGEGYLIDICLIDPHLRSEIDERCMVCAGRQFRISLLH